MEDSLLYEDIFFTRIANDPEVGALYHHPQWAGHWIGYLLPEKGEGNQPIDMSLADSWQHHVQNSSYGGSYLFCSPEPADKVRFMEQIVEQIRKLESCEHGVFGRYFLWCDLSNQEKPVIKNYIQFMKDSHEAVGNVFCDSEVKANLVQMNITEGWLGGKVKISLDHENAGFTLEQHGDSSIKFKYIHNNVGKSIKKVRLPLSKKASGTLVFTKSAVVNESGLNIEDETMIQVGICYFFFDQKEKDLKSQHFSVLGSRVKQPDKPFDFEVSFNPLYPIGQVPTIFRFINLESQGDSVIKSCFRTDFGHKITLTPQGEQAGFALQGHDEVYDSYHFVPSGPFLLGVESTENQTDSTRQLLCGLSGTETISFKPDDVITFYPGECALATAFPLKSPTEERSFFNEPGNRDLLQREYTTAWVTVHGGTSDSKNEYISQPKDATLYAKGRGVHDPESRPWALGYDQLKAADLSMAHELYPYPLVPYAKPDRHRFQHFTYKQMADFERQLLIPTRKKQITENIRLALTEEMFPCDQGVTTRKTTTPQGLLLDVDEQGNWHKLLLAHYQKPGETNLDQLYFDCVVGRLKEAFQTNQQFLVITTNLGEYVRNFENMISVAGWPFAINKDSNQGKYGDYSNVMIFKFCKGKLRDLVEKPLQWTNATDFNSTEKEGLFAVSAWLQEYLDSAQREENEFFKDFNKIVNDPNWSGILFLKVDIDITGLPEQLKGLLAGMDSNLFKAHHLGINVNYVAEPNPLVTDGAAELGIQENSSLFGLINYIDPVYEQRGMNNKAIPVYTKEHYDFKVLTLRVLFKNSEIQNFINQVQLTVNQLFEETVSCVTSKNKPDDPTDDQGCESTITSILFDGTYENREGVPSYQFRTSSPNFCWLKSNIFHYIEVVTAEFQSRKIGEGIIESKFLLRGYMNFQKLKGIDAFSFGSDPENPDRTQMLPFSDLAFRLEYDEKNQNRCTEIQYDTSAIKFHLEESKPRPNSLCHGFPLKFKRLVRGTRSGELNELGFLKVNFRLEHYDVDQMIPQYLDISDHWTGFEFELDLGSGGMLAKDSDIISRILLAWSATTVPIEPNLPSEQVVPRYNIYLGIRLPGGGEHSKLFQLQDVLQLSIDDIQLLCDLSKPNQPAFRMQFTNLALQFLNFKFPPSGTTNFILFGNTEDSKGSTQEVGWYADYAKQDGRKC